MQIVIEIDDKTYTDIKKGKIYSSYRDVPQESVSAIANGTPLPKGHGRLIDADAIDLSKYNRFCDAIDNTPTIIEADKAESEGKE